MQMQAMQPFYLHQSEPSAEKGLFLSLRFPGKLLKSLFFCHLHFLFLYFSATLLYIFQFIQKHLYLLPLLSSRSFFCHKFFCIKKIGIDKTRIHHSRKHT